MQLETLLPSQEPDKLFSAIQRVILTLKSQRNISGMEFFARLSFINQRLLSISVGKTNALLTDLVSVHYRT